MIRHGSFGIHASWVAGLYWFLAAKYVTRPQRISFNADGRPVQYIETSFVPGRVRFRIESTASTDSDTDTDAGQYVYADSAS